MPSYLTAVLLAAALVACSAPPVSAPAAPAAAPASQPAAPDPAKPAASLPHYRCDQGIDFTVRFANDTAVLDSAARGNEVLLRDAGGTTPQQSVYSNARLRAEFGLGAAGREAILRYLAPAQVVNCQLD